MERQQVDPKFRLPDALVERMEHLLPKFRRSKKGGRPRLSWRPVLDGIFYVMRTGCQWKAVPPEFGSGSSLHRYFQLLVGRGVFEHLWAMALLEYDDLKGINWGWQSMDGAMTKAPLGGGKYRPESHRSRKRWHQTQFVDGRQRHPVGHHHQRRQHA